MLISSLFKVIFQMVVHFLELRNVRIHGRDLFEFLLELLAEILLRIFKVLLLLSKCSDLYLELINEGLAFLIFTHSLNLPLKLNDILSSLISLLGKFFSLHSNLIIALS